MTSRDALDYLIHGMKADQSSQAYIIVGAPRGAGGKLAEDFLQTVFCRAGDSPCKQCAACREVVAHSHADVLWVEPQLRSRQISIEQVRDVRQRVAQTSFAGGWKACVLAAADRLGKPAANAFLKTLEEPPGRTLFLLLTDSPQFLLPTVVSRCRKILLREELIEMSEVWKSELLDILNDLVPCVGRFDIGVIACTERIRSILSQMKKAAEAMEKEIAGQEALDPEDKTLDARINARYREMRRGLMGVLLSWFRDLLLLVAGAETSVIANQGALDALEKQARHMTRRNALHNVRVVEQMNRQLEGNVPDTSVFGAWPAKLDVSG